MLEIIHNEQFDLSYYVKGITFSDTEDMSVFERRKMYGHLVKRKTEEKDKNERARSEMESNMKNRSNTKKGSTSALDAIQQQSSPAVRTGIGKPGDSRGYTI